MKKSLVYLLVLLAGFFWGLSFMAIYFLAGKLDPMQILAARWLLSAILFGCMIAFGLIRIDLRKKEAKYLFLTALIQPVFYSTFECYGVKYTSASVSSLFIATIPCMALIIGLIFFRKNPGKIGILSIILAFTGVALGTVLSPAFSVDGSMKGYLLMIAAVTMGGIFGFSSAKASEGYGAMEVTAMMAIIGAVVFNIACLFMGFGTSTYTTIFHDPSALGGIVFLGACCSTLCYTCFNKLLGYLDTAIANNLTASTTTIVGVITGVLVGGDPCGWYTIVGLILTVAGVCMSSMTIKEE